MDYKNIVLCADGTGNTTIKGRGTNVFKLFEAVDVNGHRTDPRLRRQLAFYNDGVGTQELRWIRGFAGATGYGLSRNVKQLYRELCRVYEPGDAIYLFGFSRGAFTVRTLAGLIAECGLLSPADYDSEMAFALQTRAAYKAYRRKYSALLTRLWPKRGIAADEFKARYARRDESGKPIEPRVKLLGVWDTVDAVGLPFALADFWNAVIWQFKFRTTSVSTMVEKACHALAMNDDRESFKPVLWEEGGPGDERVEQVWFAGSHSNVGGGYPQQGMSLVALDWMMTRAEEQGLRFTRYTRESYRAQSAFADRLYNPRANFGMFYRWKPRHIARLCAEKDIAVPKVHISVVERIVQAPEGYSPGNVPPNCQIVTTDSAEHVDAAAVSAAIAHVHGGASAPPLIERQAAWVRVGFAAYLAFIFGIAGAALRALYVLVDGASTPTEVVTAALPLVETFPLNVITTIATDPIATALLSAGLLIGYVLSNMSDRRTKYVYSAFWHRHRGALREATRRTPTAPAVMRDRPSRVLTGSRMG